MHLTRLPRVCSACSLVADSQLSSAPTDAGHGLPLFPHLQIAPAISAHPPGKHLGVTKGLFSEKRRVSGADKRGGRTHKEKQQSIVSRLVVVARIWCFAVSRHRPRLCGPGGTAPRSSGDGTGVFRLQSPCPVRMGEPVTSSPAALSTSSCSRCFCPRPSRFASQFSTVPVGFLGVTRSNDNPHLIWTGHMWLAMDDVVSRSFPYPIDGRSYPYFPPVFFPG